MYTQMHIHTQCQRHTAEPLSSFHVVSPSAGTHQCLPHPAPVSPHPPSPLQVHALYRPLQVLCRCSEYTCVPSVKSLCIRSCPEPHVYVNSLNAPCEAQFSPSPCYSQEGQIPCPGSPGQKVAGGLQRGPASQAPQGAGGSPLAEPLRNKCALTSQTGSAVD